MYQSICVKLKKALVTCVLCMLTTFAVAQHKKSPIMGWSSWNNFSINIDEKLIREQADAMVKSGLYKAGYRFINIDDGYFGGRDNTGKLFEDKRNSHRV